ncbi:uncharacterized protein LOC119191517 [Manduca sexta]|nr:uncharacterized protein LOC119191517 [Manduca sexta]
MTYGTTLRLPSDFIIPTAKLSHEENDYIRRLMDTMASLKSTSCSNSTGREPFVHKDLATCTHVFVRNDQVVPPLTPPYDGPYEVIKRYDKYFKIKLPLRSAVISLDRLKPAYICTETIEETADLSFRQSNQPYVTRSGRVVKPNVRFA